MAVFTIGGKSGCDVIGIGGCLVVGLVATIAIPGEVVAMGMTLGTVQMLVGSL